MGRRLFRPRTNGGLPTRTEGTAARRGACEALGGAGLKRTICSRMRVTSQRLAGASLLVLANKQDIAGAMTGAEIADVRGSVRLRMTGLD